MPLPLRGSIQGRMRDVGRSSFGRLEEQGRLTVALEQLNAALRRIAQQQGRTKVAVEEAVVTSSSVTTCIYYTSIHVRDSYVSYVLV